MMRADYIRKKRRWLENERDGRYGDIISIKWRQLVKFIYRFLRPTKPSNWYEIQLINISSKLDVNFLRYHSSPWTVQKMENYDWLKENVSVQRHGKLVTIRGYLQSCRTTWTSTRFLEYMEFRKYDRILVQLVYNPVNTVNQGRLATK